MKIKGKADYRLDMLWCVFAPCRIVDDIGTRTMRKFATIDSVIHTSHHMGTRHNPCVDHSLRTNRDST